MTIHSKEGDDGQLQWMENIITMLVVEQARGVTEYVQNGVAEVLMIRVME